MPLEIPVRGECFSRREKCIEPFRTDMQKIYHFLFLLMLLFTSHPCHASLQMTAPHNITFSTIARAPHAVIPAMYVGAAPSILSLGSAANTLAYKLARITVNDFVDGVPSDNILQPFLPLNTTSSTGVASLATVMLDGTSAPHPLADPLTVISQMTAFGGQYPILSLARYAAAGSVTPPAFAGMFMVTDDGLGASLSKATTPNDQAGEAIDVPPAALATSEKFVFAAVSKKGTQFDDLVEPTRGIAVLQETSPGTAATAGAASATVATLTPLNAINVATPGGLALPLDLTTNSNLLSFGDGTANSISRALVGRKAAMCWDEGLQRLYVGFTDVRRDDPTKAGGVLGACMVGLLNDATGALQQFTALPLVDGLGKGFFYSPMPGGLTEWSDPAAVVHGAAPAVLQGVTQAAPTPGFSVDLADIKICLQILKAANKYVASQPVTATAADLFTYLTGAVGAPAGAGLFSDAARAAVFLGNAAGAGPNYTIFGVDSGVILAAAATAADLQIAIRARLVNLLNNAKIVNKAYAQGAGTYSAYVNSLDFVYGFFSDGATDRIDFDTNIVTARNDGNDALGVSIPRLAVMNTSTGRPYLIVHSIMSTSPSTFGGTLVTEADNWIYALPLIPTGINGLPSLQGSIAQVTDDLIGKVDLTAALEYQSPTTCKGMPKRFHTAVRVGGGNPIPASWVQDMFVVGDCVYITLAGVQTGQQGVFKSTAIFDGNGIITGWTPATRVMGSALQTFGAMLDQKSGNFYSLTQTPTAGVGNNGATTGQVTQWGQGTARMHGGSSALSLDAVLGGLFDSKKGGIHGVEVFDELTYGFPKKQLSMLMAFGFDGVALAQTGKRNGSSFGPITKNTTVAIPVSSTNPSAIPLNVSLFDVATVGPITCGGVVHLPPTAAAAGWTRFYVGGFRGYAFLEVAYPGLAGSQVPDNAQFLANLATALTTGAFAPSGTPSPVVAVGEAVTRDAVTNAIRRYLHVATQTGVTVTEIVAPAPAPAPVPVPVALTGATDGVVLADGSVVATADGLQLVLAAGGAAQTLVSNTQIGQIVQLELLASRDVDGLYCLPATAYVLTLNSAMQDDVLPDPSVPTAPVDSQDLTLQLWRIGIAKNAAGTASEGKVIDMYKNNTPLKGQPRPYAQYPEMRLNFNVDGSIWFDVSSKDGFNTDFIRINSLNTPAPGLADFVPLQTSLTDIMSIDRVGNFRIGVPRREAASGAWLVPGDWGLRVNE